MESLSLSTDDEGNPKVDDGEKGEREGGEGRDGCVVIQQAYFLAVYRNGRQMED